MKQPRILVTGATGRTGSAVWRSTVTFHWADCGSRKRDHAGSGFGRHFRRLLETVKLCPAIRPLGLLAAYSGVELPAQNLLIRTQEAGARCEPDVCDSSGDRHDIDGERPHDLGRQRQIL